jgi:hypothetical protein
MQMRRWRRWKRAGRVLVLPLLGLLALRPLGVRADGSDQAPAPGERIHRIGPQATVIVNERGDVRMYDDPAQQALACKSRADCWGKALNALGVFGILTYEDLTEGVEGGGRAAQSAGPPE